MYLFIIIVFVGALVFFLYYKKQQDEAEEASEEAEMRHYESLHDKGKEILEAMNKSITDKENERHEKYGNPTFIYPRKEDVKQFSRTFEADDDYLSDWYAIEVYEEKKKLYIRWEEEFMTDYDDASHNKRLINASKGIMPFEYTLDFDDVVSYTIQEDKSSVTKTETAVTTNTGSMVKRSIIGGALLGDEGAIIGGVTADKTKSSTSYTTEHTDRSLKVTLNNFSMPMIEIHPFYQVYIDNLSAILNIILERKKQ